MAKLVGFITFDSEFTYQKGAKNTPFVGLLLREGIVDSHFFTQSLSLISEGGA
jgi:hypothetical protein